MGSSLSRPTAGLETREAARGEPGGAITQVHDRTPARSSSSSDASRPCARPLSDVGRVVRSTQGEREEGGPPSRRHRRSRGRRRAQMHRRPLSSSCELPQKHPEGGERERGRSSPPFSTSSAHDCLQREGGHRRSAGEQAWNAEAGAHKAGMARGADVAEVWTEALALLLLVLLVVGSRAFSPSTAPRSLARSSAARETARLHSAPSWAPPRPTTGSASLLLASFLLSPLARLSRPPSPLVGDPMSTPLRRITSSSVRTDAEVPRRPATDPGPSAGPSTSASLALALSALRSPLPRARRRRPSMSNSTGVCRPPNTSALLADTSPPDAAALFQLKAVYGWLSHRLLNVRSALDHFDSRWCNFLPAERAHFVRRALYIYTTRSDHSGVRPCSRCTAPSFSPARSCDMC